MYGKIKRTAAAVTAALLSVVPLAACKGAPTPPYTEDGYSVVLDYNDEQSRPHTVYVAKDGTMQQPAEPLRDGYTIAGWYTDRESGTEVTFPYKPQSDTVTLYAHWRAAEYSVTFDFNYENSVPLVRQAERGSAIDAPEASDIPDRDGYDFYRWETRAQGGDAVVFPYTVARDVTFYASWLSEGTQIYYVTFDTNYAGGESFEPVEVVQGGGILQRNFPQPKARPGYVMLGWATTPNATTPDIPRGTYRPTQTTTLYAVWEVQRSFKRFRWNYYGAPADFYIDEEFFGETTIEEPVAPTRAGYIFDGWYTATPEGEKVTFPLTASQTTTLYAHWKSEFVTTNIFDAEFTVINSMMMYPNYSGSDTGVGIIKSDVGGSRGASSQSYPSPNLKQYVNDDLYVGGMYVPNASLIFNITSSADVDNVTLYLSAVSEMPDQTMLAPTGSLGYRVNVNGTDIEYSPINIGGTRFAEHVISVNVSLRRGENTIRLIVNNNTVNSVMGAACPMVDYIRLDTGGRATLSWQPEYDNLNRMR